MIVPDTLLRGRSGLCFPSVLTTVVPCGVVLHSYPPDGTIYGCAKWRVPQSLPTLGAIRCPNWAEHATLAQL